MGVLARTADPGAAGARVGDGDVRVLPGRPGRTYIQLRSGTGAALLEVETERLHEFVRASEDCVPPGAESGWLDWDAELTRLLYD
ncbi:SsgA family sporulation/cell division regulator [Streptacidiphilus monticola]